MLGPESNERMGFPPILVHERCVVIQQSRGEEAQAAAWLHYAKWKAERGILETKIRDTAKKQQKLTDEKAAAYQKLKEVAVAGLQEKVKSLEVEVRRSIDDSKKHEDQSMKHQIS
ncbi:hypothetical protein FOZG_18485 [Fusarium oxysporum Fo47]|uniref:Uncharacterized protein n=1 Tax=Fusarium oxysporum Fo47 TaxID=660027 RepID=W9J702_FUSOX|nr:hypothetical protein FOZG_18485 [Fusarium oxysporum Fo47]